MVGTGGAADPPGALPVHVVALAVGPGAAPHLASVLPAVPPVSATAVPHTLQSHTAYIYSLGENNPEMELQE